MVKKSWVINFDYMKVGEWNHGLCGFTRIEKSWKRNNMFFRTKAEAQEKLKEIKKLLPKTPHCDSVVIRNY